VPFVPLSPEPKPPDAMPAARRNSRGRALSDPSAFVTEPSPTGGVPAGSASATERAFTVPSAVFHESVTLEGRKAMLAQRRKSTVEASGTAAPTVATLTEQLVLQQLLSGEPVAEHFDRSLPKAGKLLVADVRTHKPHLRRCVHTAVSSPCAHAHPGVVSPRP
jgi:hypothetical protein